MKKKYLFLISLMLLSIGIVSALFAFPGSITSNLSAQTCSKEKSASASHNYSSLCTNSYPSACGNSGDLVSCNDGLTENSTYNTGSFGGVNIKSYNSSIINCANVSQVLLCYEWWVSSTTSINNCDVQVDANGGASFSNVTTTCPATTTNPGVTCTNVTALETWGCGNFFGTNGTRAIARDEVSHGGGASSRNLFTDVLFFNVTYNANTAPYNISLNLPTNNTQINDTKSSNFNFTATDAESSTLNCSIYSDGALNQSNSTTLNATLTNFLINGIAYGSHNWKVNCSDGTLTNVSETRNFSIADTTSPTISFPIYTNATKLKNTQSLTFNISAIDSGIGTDSCVINVAGNTNQTVKASSNWCNGTYALTGIVDGNQTINSYANDTSGNFGLNRSLVVFVDSTAPQFTTIPPNDTITYPGAWAGRSFTATDSGVGLSSYFVNDSRFTINSTGFLNATAILAAGSYLVNVSANDTLNNVNSTLYLLTVNKGVLNGSLTSSHIGGFTYTYDNLSTTISFTSSNSGDGDVNYTIYRNSSYKVANETINLPAGIYSYTLNSTGGANWSANVSIYPKILNINKNSSVLYTLFNETSPVIYPKTFTVYSNSTFNFTILRNGTLVANNSQQILGAGAYNFSTIRTDQTNYSGNIVEQDFIVSKATPAGSLSGASPIIYGSPGNIQGNKSNNGDGDVNYTLYRNGTYVSNPDTTVLGAGTWNYVFNTTGGSNYSSNFSMATFNLIVNQATGLVQTFINNSRSNLTVYNGTNVLLNATTVSGEGTVNIYENGALISSGIGNLSNYTSLNTVGLYNITSILVATQNYTASFETFWMNVTVAPPTISIINPLNTTYNSTNILVNISSNGDNTWYNWNGTNTTYTSPVFVDFNNGSNTLYAYTNDSFGNTNQTSVTFTTNPDSDGDGIPDYTDFLLYNQSAVSTSGLTSFDIKVNGTSNLESSGFPGVNTMSFYDNGSVFMNFTHNFTANKFDLSKVSVEKTSVSLVVNLSGQLTSGETKTMYLDDNNFTNLCVKDANIASASDISAGCNGANETDFTSCLGNSTGVTINGITCSESSAIIKIENLSYSGILGTQASPVSNGPPTGGGGNIILPSTLVTASVVCDPVWQCTAFSEQCVNGIETRVCIDINNCGTLAGRPSTEQSCTVIPVNGNANAGNNVGGTTNAPSGTITGSVVGAIGSPTGIVIVLLVLAALTVFFIILAKKRKRKKNFGY